MLVQQLPLCFCQIFLHYKFQEETSPPYSRIVNLVGTSSQFYLEYWQSLAYELAIFQSSHKMKYLKSPPFWLCRIDSKYLWGSMQNPKEYRFLISFKNICLIFPRPCILIQILWCTCPHRSNSTTWARPNVSQLQPEGQSGSIFFFINKLYWNTATPVCLYNDSTCFCVTLCRSK